MIETGAGDYIVYEDWVELRRFSKPDAALRFQKFIKDFHPRSTVKVWHKQGFTLSLIEEEAPRSVSGTASQKSFTLLKGGGKRMENGKENKPVKKFTAGAVSAALWTNTTTLKDGRTIEMLSVSLDRRYKDSDGWKSSSSFKENDIPKAMIVLGKAFEFMTSKEVSEADGTAE